MSITQNGVLKKDDNDNPVMGGTSSADNATIINAAFDPVTRRLLTDAAAAAGTVTSVSVVTANGFAGSVATATTTPAITLSTTITGILQGNGTAISAASTTGSGAVVLATSPTLVTPVIGAATGTSLALTGSITTGTSLVLEEPGAGTDTITVQAPAAVDASWSLTLPPNDGASGQVLTTDGNGVTTWETPSSGTTFVDNEVVAGSGTAFTLAGTPVAGSVHLYGFGQRLTPGGVDYTISGASITMVNSFSAGSVLADYRT